MLQLRCAGALLLLLACTRPYDPRPLRESPCPPAPQLPPVQTVAAAPGSVIGQVGFARSGRPVPAARVRIPALGRTVVADTIGRFRFDSVPPGRYTLDVRQIGAEPREVRDVLVASDEGRAIVVFLRQAVLDGCSGFGEVVMSRPWWRVW